MADTVRTHARLTLREFLEWEERQPHKHELIDGLVKSMAGGTNRHNLIAVNIVAGLKGVLRGGPCRPCNSDTKVLAAFGQSFYPDATVDCGPFDGAAVAASTPTIVFEVLSKSTRDDDFEFKLPAYQATVSLRQIVFVEPDRTHVMVWTRTEAGWIESELVHPDGALALEGLDVSLPLAVIYEDAAG